MSLEPPNEASGGTPEGAPPNAKVGVDDLYWRFVPAEGGAGRNGKGALFVGLPDDVGGGGNATPLHGDTVQITSHQERREFAEALCSKCPRLDREAVMNRLLQLAARH